MVEGVKDAIQSRSDGFEPGVKGDEESRRVGAVNGNEYALMQS